MVPQTTQRRAAPRVAQMAERNSDADQDLIVVLYRKAVKEHLRCWGGKGPLLNPDIRLSAELSQNVDCQNSRSWIGTLDEVHCGLECGVVSSVVKRHNVVPAFVTVGRQRQRPAEDRFRAFHHTMMPLRRSVDKHHR